MDRFSTNDKVQLSIANYEDVIVARQKVREMMNAMGFSLLEQTRIITAVSELSRNIVVHAKKGQMTAQFVEKNLSPGIRCVFEDHGPGIPDIVRAMEQGFSTTNSLGLGLSGAKNLCAEFEITSMAGQGTRITIAEWRKKRS